METRPGFVARDAIRVDGSRNGKQAGFRDAAKDHFAEPDPIDALPKPPRKQRCGR